MGLGMRVGVVSMEYLCGVPVSPCPSDGGGGGGGGGAWSVERGAWSWSVELERGAWGALDVQRSSLPPIRPTNHPDAPIHPTNLQRAASTGPSRGHARDRTVTGNKATIMTEV